MQKIQLSSKKSFITLLTIFLLQINYQCSSSTSLIEGMFIAVNDSYTYMDAHDYCLNHGYDGLASIHSETENNEAFDLCKLMEPISCWIGLRNNGSIWYWESDFNRIDYENWGRYQPDTDPPDAAVRMNVDGHWDDVNRNDPIYHKFVCDGSDTDNLYYHYNDYDISDDDNNTILQCMTNTSTETFRMGFKIDVTNKTDDNCSNYQYILSYTDLFKCDQDFVCNVNCMMKCDNINLQQDLEIYCDNKTICNDLFIDIDPGINVQFWSTVDASDIIINGPDANNITIYIPNRHKALANSWIYAGNARKLNISCMGIRHNEVCFDLHIFLSENPYSNTINCGGNGCSNLHLYFPNNYVNFSLFNNITFNGCKVYDNIYQYINTQWTIYHHNQSDDDYIFIENISQISFIDNTYSCDEFQYILSNKPVEIISIILSILYLIGLFVLIILMLHHHCYIWKKRRLRQYISKQPPLYTLLYAIYSDILLYIAILWWSVKIIMLFDISNKYCSTGYVSDDGDVCDADILCVYNIYDGCEQNDGILSLFMTWCFILGLISIMEALRVMKYIDTKCISNEDTQIYKWCLCDCCMLCTYYKIKQDKQLFNDIYGKRNFWFDVVRWSIFDRTACVWICCVRYLICIILAFINTILFRNYSMDFLIKWYEFVPVLLLFIIKIILIFCYSYGPKYDPEREEPQQIKEILYHKFGNDIGYVIRTYLSIFYSKRICSSGILLTEDDAKKFDNGTIDLYQSIETVELIPFTH